MNSQSIWALSIVHTFISWASSPNLHPPLSFSTMRSLTTHLFLVTRHQPIEVHRTQAGSQERAGGDFCPSSLPVGDGDQLRAMVGTQPPGITVGHLVLSQPVAGWAMPRPTLAREKRQEGGWLWEEDSTLSCQCLCSSDIRMWLGMCRTEGTTLAPEISACSMFCLRLLSATTTNNCWTWAGALLQTADSPA